MGGKYVCVMGVGLGEGGLKLREILYFPARRVEVYAGLFSSFRQKYHIQQRHFTDFNNNGAISSNDLSG